MREHLAAPNVKPKELSALRNIWLGPKRLPFRELPPREFSSGMRLQFLPSNIESTTCDPHNRKRTGTAAQNPASRNGACTDKGRNHQTWLIQDGFCRVMIYICMHLTFLQFPIQSGSLSRVLFGFVLPWEIQCVLWFADSSVLLVNYWENPNRIRGEAQVFSGETESVDIIFLYKEQRSTFRN